MIKKKPHRQVRILIWLLALEIDVFPLSKLACFFFLALQLMNLFCTKLAFMLLAHMVFVYKKTDLVPHCSTSSSSFPRKQPMKAKSLMTPILSSIRCLVTYCPPLFEVPNHHSHHSFPTATAKALSIQ